MVKQQGDVIVRRIDEKDLPDNIKEVKPTNGRLVLAEGEHSGHAHVIREQHKAMLFQLGAVLYLKVLEICVLYHNEHNSFELDPDVYEITRIQETDPYEKRVRAVID